MKNKKVCEAAKLLAKQGGNATLKKHGKKHYKKMAQIRWNKVGRKSRDKK